MGRSGLRQVRGLRRRRLPARDRRLLGAGVARIHGARRSPAATASQRDRRPRPATRRRPARSRPACVAAGARQPDASRSASASCSWSAWTATSPGPQLDRRRSRPTTSGRCCSTRSAAGPPRSPRGPPRMQALAPSGTGGVALLHRRQPGGRADPAAHRARVRHHAVRARAGRLDGGHAARSRRPAGGPTCAPRASTSTSRRSWTWCRQGRRRPTRRSARLTGSSAPTRRPTARTAPPSSRGWPTAGVATVAKHFPGLGRVTGNTDFTADVVDNVTTADDPYLNSFRAAIGAGVPMVMVALATYTRIDPSQLAVFSPVVMRLLRDRARLRRRHRLRRPRRGAGGAGDPGGNAGDRLPHRGRRPDHLAEPRPRRADGGRGARQGVGRAPRSAPRSTPPRARVLTAKQAAGLLPC